MTSEQYYYPYFFNQSVFNNSIEKFGLNTKAIFDKKTKLTKELIITKKNKFKIFSNEKELLKIPFGTFLMIVENELIYWNVDEEILNIYKINLIELDENVEPTNSQINVSEMILGTNIHQTNLELNNFVTFVRKNDLKYDLPFYEKYVIAIIENEVIKLIPFDKFNKLGGDYGYVWPAIAKIDLESKILYGKGMRMDDFELQIE